MYEIEQKSDFITGATLIVSIDEKDLDKKAFYTMLADLPEFVLPFNHRTIDGKIEFTYQVGNKNKFIYLTGNRSVEDYAELWGTLLQPLLDCGDWFMDPYAFVLNTNYLYFDKEKNKIVYIYIPSKQAYSNYDTLKNMVIEIAKENRVDDINLENKVVWAIQDFNTVNFVKMIKTYARGAPDKVIKKHTISIQHMEDKPIDALQNQEPAQKMPKEEPLPEKPQQAPEKQNDLGDIIIKLPTIEEPGKKIKKAGFFSKRKEKNQKIILKPLNNEKQLDTPDAAINPPVKHTPDKTPKWAKETETNVTQYEAAYSPGPKFRYAGNGEYPPSIIINTQNNNVFSIGRFDASIGQKKSDFEFDKKTKAVSRRHAVIEKDAEGYKITDMNSTYGTYINGQKLPPSTPFKLEPEMRVSFGSGGADYIWEE